MRAKTFVYAGIVIPTQTKTNLVKKTTCPTHGQTFNKLPFCPYCGNKIIEKEVEVTKSLDAYDLLGNDQLYSVQSNDKTFLMSNVGIRQAVIPHEEPIEISQELINAKIRNFELCHEKEIEMLKSKVNADIKVSFFVLVE